MYKKGLWDPSGQAKRVGETAKAHSHTDDRVLEDSPQGVGGSSGCFLDKYGSEFSLSLGKFTQALGQQGHHSLSCLEEQAISVPKGATLTFLRDLCPTWGTWKLSLLPTPPARAAEQFTDRSKHIVKVLRSL